MRPFMVDRRRLVELAVLIVAAVVIFFVLDGFSACLFSFGFIWNWTASQELHSLLENPRYRFSMVKFVGNVHGMFLRPVQSLPRFVQFLVSALPAGIFWGMVILINNSLMPWWMTFAGSLFYEILRLELSFLRKGKETPP